MWMSFTSCEWLTRCCVWVIRSLINFSVLRTLVQHHTQQLQIYGENLLGRGVMKLAWLVWLVVMTMSWILSMWSRVESGDFPVDLRNACVYDWASLNLGTLAGKSQYFVLALLDQLIQDTAEAGKPKKSYHVFYDIGCTLEKSVQKVSPAVLSNKWTVQCLMSGLLDFTEQVFQGGVPEWSQICN